MYATTEEMCFIHPCEVHFLLSCQGVGGNEGLLSGGNREGFQFAPEE